MNFENYMSAFVTKINSDKKKYKGFQHLIKNEVNKLFAHKFLFFYTVFSDKNLNIEFEAWEYGPVSRDMYYKWFEIKSLIKTDFEVEGIIDDNVFTKTINFFNFIGKRTSKESIGDISIWKIIDETHSLSEWIVNEKISGIMNLESCRRELSEKYSYDDKGMKFSENKIKNSWA